MNEPRWPSSPLASACALALLCGCVIDVAADGEPIRVHFAVCLAGLALGVGALYGLVWRLAFWLLRFLPGRSAYAVWSAASFAVSARLAFLLGATKRLQGTYSRLALAVIVGCTLLAVLASALSCGMQPVGREGRALLPERNPRARLAISCALLGTAMLFGWADATQYTGLYPLAHFALRMGALFLGMFGLALSHDLVRLPTFGALRALALCLLLAYVLRTLDENAPRTLQAFAARPWPAMVLAAARDALDYDRDGYSSWLGGGDCAPWNPRVHPGAAEIPDNGIDDNCAMGDAHRKIVPTTQVPVPTKPAQLDIVLITVDSLRRDRVGVYTPGGGPPRRLLTPTLDAWARHGTIFDRAYTPGGWTSLALPSMLRGVYPRRLRWRRFYQTSTGRLLHAPLAPQMKPGETPVWLFAFPSDDPHVPLPRWLSRRGMYTAAVVDDGPGEILRRGTGIDVGFESYTEVNPGPSSARDDADTATLAITALERMPPGKRFFLWVHFFGVHGPNEHHPGIPTYGPSVADGYDHEVRYLDLQLGRLLAALDRRKATTAVFVTADHGEELPRGGRHHGYSLAEELIHIPMIAQVPGWPAGDVGALASLLDLAPTVLALTDTPGPNDLDGIDLAPLIAQPSAPARVLLSDTWRFDVDERLIADLVAAYDGRRKVLIDELGHGFFQYDQTKASAPPVALQNGASDPLGRVALGYLEDTGGMPVPSD
ncbi:MAG: sulfatase-like hydrolase/transferase [Polyangiales bacterium]